MVRRCRDFGYGASYIPEGGFGGQAADDVFGSGGGYQDGEASGSRRNEVFDKLVEDAAIPVYPGSKKHTKLSITALLASIKTDHNLPDAGFDRIMGAVHQAFDMPDNSFPKSFYEVKKTMKKIGHEVLYYDACRHDCMLFYGDDINLTRCKWCHKDRYRPRKGQNGKRVAYKTMQYMPIAERLQRLFSSPITCGEMNFHAREKKDSNAMTHPSDGSAWEDFDIDYPDFAAEPRNVRLGLCTDGFNPFNKGTHSCWPVIVTPYNLPEELCMSQRHMFLTCMIPGPRSPGRRIDVYFRPLIDDLKKLWHQGIDTMDHHRGEVFRMRAAVLWTVNDFPALGMISGYSTSGYEACPVCMEESDGIWLNNGKKVSWFDQTRKFLPMNHRNRRDDRSFLKGVKVQTPPPQRMNGRDTFDKYIKELPTIEETDPNCKHGHRGFTKRCIF